MEPNPYESPRQRSEPPNRPKPLGVDAVFLLECAALVFVLFVVPFFVIPLFVK
jgi:hypothetical protein